MERDSARNHDAIASIHDGNAVKLYKDLEQRNYFSFYDYEYCLDVSKQYELMPQTGSLFEGLQDAFGWYIENGDKVNKKPFMAYINQNLM